MRPTLTIPRPCHENWAAMTPAPEGRHCASCQKTVVDFTHQTDAEILAYLARAASGRTCGRFAAGQLDRPLQRAELAAPMARWRNWLAAAAAVWAVREVGSPAARGQALTEQHAPSSAAALQHSAISRPRPMDDRAMTAITLRGVVHDAGTSEGLPGVTVLLQGTQTGVSSAADGSFVLPLPAGLAADRATVLFASLGYKSQLLSASAFGSGPQIIKLEEDATALAGEVIVMGGIGPRAMPPAPWHARRFYHWGKYWVTRPFRRG